MGENKITGAIISVDYSNNVFKLKDEKTGITYLLFYPNTKELKSGEVITASVPIEGRAEKITIPSIEGEFDIAKGLSESYVLISQGKYDQAEKVLDRILAKDPGNPLALNNLAAVMVGMKKFDKADTLLHQALPKAQGYIVEVNRVCSVGNICIVLRPVAGTTGNQELAPLIKMNIEMVKGMMTAAPIPGKGMR